MLVGLLSAWAEVVCSASARLPESQLLPPSGPARASQTLLGATPLGLGGPCGMSNDSQLSAQNTGSYEQPQGTPMSRLPSAVTLRQPPPGRDPGVPESQGGSEGMGVGA